MASDRTGSLIQANLGGGSGPAPGVAVQAGGIGASLTTSTDAGGDIQVQFTGVLALVLLALAVFAAHKLM